MTSVETSEPTSEATLATQHRLADVVERFRALFADPGEPPELDAVVAIHEELKAVRFECYATPRCDIHALSEANDALLEDAIAALVSQVERSEALAANQDDAVVEPGTVSFVEELPEVAESVDLLRGNKLGDLIQLNGPVKAAIDDWLTWKRPLLMDAYEHYQHLRNRMAPIYEEADLPEALLFAMVATESGGKAHAYSRVGAAGLLQFMPATARRYGLGSVDGLDMRLDAASATGANVRYLNDHFAIFNESLEKVLAAYNWGEGRMGRLQRRMGDTPFWNSEFFYSLPKETRDYVPSILAAAWLFLHPEDYNLDLGGKGEDAVALTLERPSSLSELTICAGQAGEPRAGWFRTLRNLNPQVQPSAKLEKGDTLFVPPAVAEAYPDQCLEGPLVELASELHAANYPEGSELIVYRVRRGDSLSRIASRHRCVTTRELAAINNLRAPRYLIRIGQRLKVPDC